MKAWSSLTLATAALLLAACEHTPPRQILPPSHADKQPAGTQTAGTPGVVCTREVPTGLRMAVTKCRQQDDVAQRRELDKDWAQRIPAELPKER